MARAHVHLWAQKRQAAKALANAVTTAEPKHFRVTLTENLTVDDSM